MSDKIDKFALSVVNVEVLFFKAKLGWKLFYKVPGARETHSKFDVYSHRRKNSQICPLKFFHSQLAEVALTSPDPILRCAAGEALGRMAQVIGDPKFISTMAQVKIGEVGHI